MRALFAVAVVVGSSTASHAEPPALGGAVRGGVASTQFNEYLRMYSPMFEAEVTYRGLPTTYLGAMVSFSRFTLHEDTDLANVANTDHKNLFDIGAKLSRKIGPAIAGIAAGVELDVETNSVYKTTVPISPLLEAHIAYCIPSADQPGLQLFVAVLTGDYGSWPKSSWRGDAGVGFHF